MQQRVCVLGVRRSRLPAGCALERILGEGDWPVELAGRWLLIREQIGSAADWQPAGFFSTLLT